MCSGDDEHFFTDEEFVVQQLRQGAKLKALIEHMLEFHVAPGDCIADHHEIRFWFEIPRIERLGDRDVEFAKEIGHRRISSRVGTRHAESALS